MTFAAPFMLAGLAFLLPVFVAFLVKRRRDVVRVPSTLLWRSVAIARVRNRRIRHLSRLLALLACLAAVGLLVLAAARPAGTTVGETVAIVVDVSASMGSGEDSGPLEEAREELRRLVVARGPHDRVAIIAAGPIPERLAGPTADAELLARAIEALSPTRGASDHGAAVELATELVRGRPGARVLLLSDGGEAAGDPPEQDEAVPLLARTFGRESGDNLGITAFAARPPVDATTDDERELLVGVASSSTVARRAEVTITSAGVTLAHRTVDVPVGEEVDARIRVQVAEGELVATLGPADGLPDVLGGDDSARLVAGRPVPPRALLIVSEEAAADAFFVERALVAAGVREVKQVTAEAAHEEAEEGDLVVALGTGPARRLDAPTLYIATREGSMPVSGVRELEGADETRLRSVSERHALLRGVVLDGVTIEGAVAVEVPEDGQALVDLDGGTVVAGGGAGRRSWVYLGVDPTRSDMVLRVAFPVLLANALSVLGGASEVVVGETVPRSEVALRAAEPTDGVAEAPAPRWALPASPPVWLAALAVLLLAAELFAFRRGWAS